MSAHTSEVFNPTLSPPIYGEVEPTREFLVSLTRSYCWTLYSLQAMLIVGLGLVTFISFYRMFTEDSDGTALPILSILCLVACAGWVSLSTPVRVPKMPTQQQFMQEQMLRMSVNGEPTTGATAPSEQDSVRITEFNQLNAKLDSLTAAIEHLIVSNSLASSTKK